MGANAAWIDQQANARRSRERARVCWFLGFSLSVEAGRGGELEDVGGFFASGMCLSFFSVPLRSLPYQPC